MENIKIASTVGLKFIDLFAGCGGMSLGLAQAGMQGQFAIEKDSMAFRTFSENFLGNRELPIGKFTWPSWLEQRAWAIDDFLSQHQEELASLRGQIDLIAGGPPCQGFSFAGRRQESDPRNMLFERYVKVVDLVKPSALVLENVPGMRVAYLPEESKDKPSQDKAESYFDKLKRSLEGIGYEVDGHLVDASLFGVPQKRSRLIVIGLRKELASRLEGGIKRVFQLLEFKRVEQLSQLNLPEPVTAGQAISDLLVGAGPRKECIDPDSPAGFHEAHYPGPGTPYQRLMHEHCQDEDMDSMRLARHGAEVSSRFAAILNECSRGVAMSKLNREKYGLKKHRIHPMCGEEPAPTITTLPDDVLHYAEPRILTVRESARLQSFPDWFRFRGKFTTGGDRRTKECPRYTQVGNAVPPLLGRAIGKAIEEALRQARCCLVEQPEGQAASFLNKLTAIA